MRTDNSLAILTLLFSFNIYAASVIDAPKFKTPSSPAFVLLGIEPSAVERPSTPQAFAANAVFLAQNIKTLPKNYAFEVAPYWLVSHPELTFEEFYNPQKLNNIIYTLSLSVATTTQNLDNGSQISFIGMGAKWQFLTGRPSDSLSYYVNEIKKTQDSQLDNDEAEIPIEIRTKLKELSTKVTNINNKPVGWIVEGAIAGALGFTESEIKNNDSKKIGVWISTTYRVPKPYIDFIATARLFYNKINLYEETIADIGGKIAYEIGKFSISCEGVARSEIKPLTKDAIDDTTLNAFEMRNSNRLCAIKEYEVANDLYLTGTFGKDFKKNGSGDLLSQFNITWGFGGQKTLLVK